MGFLLQGSHLSSQTPSNITFVDFEEDCEQQSLIDSLHTGFYGPGYENYKNRQLFLQSYKFTRDRTLSERWKSCLSKTKFKAAAWAVMVCNYRPLLAKKIKKAFNSTKNCLRSGAPLVLPSTKSLRVSG